MNVDDSTRIWHIQKSVILDCTIGKDCTIHAPVWIGDGVVIGDRCKVQAFAFIPEGVTIEDDVFIGPHVCFTNDRHPPSGRENWLPTLVRQGARICAGAIILPGVTIGARALIGAGAVVTHSVPPGEVWTGLPAHPHPCE